VLRAIRTAQPRYLIPSDDRAVWQLHALHECEPGVRALIEASIGCSIHYRTVRSRVRFLELAARAGLRTPETRPVATERELQQWFDSHPGPAVLKRDGTYGGSGVEIVNSAHQGREAWQKLTAFTRPGLAWKRWLINRDPLAFWHETQDFKPAVSVQTYISGQLANAMAVCWQGEILGVVAVNVLGTQGETGASTIVQIVRDQRISDAMGAIAGALGLSGFFGLDFILEQGTGVPHVLELNARCTQLGHLVLAEQGDLVGLLCSKLGGDSSLRPGASLEHDIIAFFPQALVWNRGSPYLLNCHHDVPWDEPELVRELLCDPWPERQWIARLYHRLRGTARIPLPEMPDLLRLAAGSGVCLGSAGDELGDVAPSPAVLKQFGAESEASRALSLTR
jgi:hypothetical protein